MYILVIDDERFANELVQFALRKEGFEVETLDNARHALQMIEKREPDLLILDVTMPYITGFEFFTQLRTAGYETPVIFVTAKDSVEDKLYGFKIGAEDYICKPYNFQELVARVHAVMRRVKKNKTIGEQVIRGGQFELLPAELKLAMPDRPAIILTPKEMQVMRMLMAYAGQVVKREQLLSEVWNDNDSNSNIVDVYMRRLRKKLEADADRPQHIISVRGLGYKFIGR